MDEHQKLEGRAKRHYDKHKARISEQRKKRKTYFQLIEEQQEESERQQAHFLVERTPLRLMNNSKNREAVNNLFQLFIQQQQLTESETLKIRKNKRLVQRWQMFLKSLEQQIDATIAKKVAKK
ncbi:hypothetical protein ACG9VV_000867 [Vibrio alginolyticus]|uniref:hypothetical protein n=1 Tax=Vibrio alginolyticus TaxID=663 RepID=UPI00374A57F5